jgi:outer membrane protein OmpA-like peptidoglycan-associated protein
MLRILRFFVVVAFIALPLAAQTNLPDLVQAQQVLVLADNAGAQQYAKSLYDDAAYRIRFAQENVNSPKPAVQEQARMRAREALFAARAALAKARWLSTNAAVRNLQADINRFGGRADVALRDEDVNIDFHRGSTTKERIDTAQAAVDQARAVGAEQSVPDNDLKAAQDNIESARKVSRNGRDNSDVADHLAYVAEMMARRAYYAAQFNTSSRFVPDLQLQRTRLAQSSSEAQASAERAQREEAERRAADLQRQLASEAANRQAQTAELERLREQVEESRRAMQQRIEFDRAARLEAERRLDDAMRKYEAAVVSGNQADIDRLRREVEDQEITLRTVQERERLDAQAMSADVEAMRSDIQTAQNQPNADATIIAQRQADLARRESELNQYRTEVQTDVNARANIQQRHEAAVAAAQKQRQESEAQAQAMRQQMEQAQAAAQQAQQQAQQAQQQAQQTQQQLQQAQQQAEQQKLQAQQAQQQLTQQAQQSASEAEKARQAAAAAEAELEKTRAALAQREEEARQLRMQQELARIAATKAESRGIVVTLPGIFFDPGKTALKPGAKKTLQRIAARLKSDEEIRVSVEGHTDNTGTPEKNMDISEKRAEAVREYLVNQGVPGDRVMATGKGDAEPVATNKTVAGRQQNRRVELVITR